ncbi:MAG TPA: sigma-70 family RNA polymerase sigma factor [Xanthobacteraceae bacterium]|nr:sigma-70 family RNA polymerase sigma factor [Xanthobacteraceae bacterium]
MNAPDHTALILAIARNGDRAAFAALFQHFAPRLKSYLIRAGAPAASAEELAQEALLSVWRKASYFDPAKAGAAAWIFSIARNLRIDALRRQGRAARIEPDPSDEPDAVPGADSLLGLAERERHVRSALGALSAEQRRVIELAFFEDKPHSAIAQELGIPLGTVKSRLRLAMGRLRTLLDDAS